MMLWIALVTLAVCTAALICLPFLRPTINAGANVADIYKQQLRELAQEELEGKVDTDTAAGERISIERRLLAEPAPAREIISTTRADRRTAIAIALIVILGAVGLYAATGEPGISSSSRSAVAVASDTPMAAAPATPQRNLPDVDTMIARLAERLKSEPNDGEGWRMLGWSYFETQHYSEAVDAYAHAVALMPNSADDQSAYGEAQVQAANGAVTDKALIAFNAALAASPADARAHYYIGLAKKQQGDVVGGISEWTAALRKVPAGSPWATRLQAQIDANSNISLAKPEPRFPAIGKPIEQSVRTAGASAGQSQSIPAQDQQAMISGMVGGLDQRLRQNPNNPDGWIRLIRSRKVLGQDKLARDALNRALAAFANDDTTRQNIAAAAHALGVDR